MSQDGVKYSDVVQRTSRLSLALGELEALPSSGLTGLLTLLHPRIPPKKSLSFERGTKFRIGIDQRARDRKAQRPSLTVDSAAIRIHPHVKLVELLRNFKRTQDGVLESLRLEVILESATIHDDFARTGCETHSRDCRFPAAHCDIFRSICSHS